MKKHSRALVRAIDSVVGHPCLGAEIGVWEGCNSAALLENYKDLELLMVDAYRAYGDFRLGKFERRRYHQAMAKAADLTELFNERRWLVVGDSVSTSVWIADECLDFVFIDGDHSYEGVLRDLISWWPKVRKGGLISGHDYGGKGDRTGRFGVKKAVDGFFKEKDCEVRLESALVWWAKK